MEKNRIIKIIRIYRIIENKAGSLSALRTLKK